MSAPMTVLGLVNGMVGSSCLVLPVVGLTAGYITTIWVCLIIGYISYYTAYLIVLHLGKGRNIKESILAHYQADYKYMVGYSFFIWLSFIPMLVTYFRIICLQIEGLMGFSSPWVGPAVAILLVAGIIIIRVRQFGEEILAFGIISIITYIFFLIWAQATAPEGTQAVPANGNPVILAAVLIGAYEIHDFLAQNLLKNPRREEYQSVVKHTFLFGGLCYVFVTLGSLGTSLLKQQSSIVFP
jgi:hypothetical protein